jgi:hypothetical protein
MTLADPTGGAMGSRAFRDSLLCLSLANLYFINVWVELGNRGFDFFRGARPAATAFWAVATLIVMLSLISGSPCSCGAACHRCWRVRRRSSVSR